MATKPSVILIPGWGLTGHSFSWILCQKTRMHLAREYDAYYYDYAEPAILSELKRRLENASAPVQLVGFSLGASLAIELTKLYPDTVSRLHLIGYRPSYPSATIQAVRQGLFRLKERYLSYFFKACFTESADYDAFSSQSPSMIAKFNPSRLEEGLRYLETHEEACPPKTSAAIQLYHGKDDTIAPFQEIWTIDASEKSRAPQIKIHQSHHGHLPPLSEPISLNFSEKPSFF